jgi:hypothetical protein
MKNKVRAIGLRDLVDGLLFSLKAEGKSVRTISYYQKLIHPLLNYSRDKGWSNDLKSLDAQRVREFLSWVGTKSCTSVGGNGAKLVRKANPSTAWHYLRALRRLFNWAIEMLPMVSVAMISTQISSRETACIDDGTIFICLHRRPR